MTKSTITREQLLEIIETDHVQCGEASYLARMALAAMASESECLPIDYLQGHKDGLEWAAKLAEANHPETGDWLYDDPIELAKAIRKGPDMPPVQPAPVVPDDVLKALQKVARIRLDMDDFDGDRRGIADCLCDAEEALIEVVNRRAAMLAAAPQSPGSEPATVPGKWIPVSERMPEAEGCYLVWANASRIDGYCDHLAIATYQGGEWSNEFNWLVNHWMPLPASPQEAINLLIPLASRNEQEVR